MNNTKPIKIFVDAHVFDKEYQGTRTFLKEIYTHLSGKENLRLFLGAFDIENLKTNFTENSNITFIRYKKRSGFARLMFDIPSILRKHQIDLAHFQYIIPPVKICRYIVTIHDTIFKEYPREFPLFYRLSRNYLFKRATAKADLITTVSDYSKKSIEKYLYVKKEKIELIPNGVSDLFFKPYDKQSSQNFIKNKYGIGKFILYVSRFEPRKNHESLLKAFLDLKLYEQGYFLVLLGHHSLRNGKFDEIINGLPQEIRKFIFISSKVNDQELLTFYQSATAFVYPSRYEGFGISPLEAAALKIPVICSNTTGMEDFSFFGDLHIDPDNYDLLKKKLAEILTHPPDDNQLQKIADVIRKNYSWEKPAEDFYQLLLQGFKNWKSK